jgi:predicted DNA-binding transcriptional regulator AlpA
MKIKETAEALKISESTVKRNWAMGKIWLYKEMQKQQNPKPIKAEFGDGYH